jgi:predicted  nucleic acid-binding Zn-ribbon protein
MNQRFFQVARVQRIVHCLAVVSSASFACCAFAEEPTKITFEDHIKPIFREHCTSCHNANDKKSGLALDTYQAVMTGGSGGDVVTANDLDASRLYALTAHKEQPFMPPNQDMIPQAKVDLLKVWIEQGMPENSGSAIKKPKASAAALGMVSAARPEGAPPMPTTMIKQTPFFTPRAATISALAASPWSPLVAVGGQMQVSLYHSETGQLQGIIPFPEGEPQSITFSRDGKLILIAGGRHSASGCAALHDIATGNRIARVGDELDIVFAADISDDNQLIAMAGPQKMVRVYETLTGNLKYEQKKHTDWIYAVRFSPDGLLLATADRAAGLVVWESQTGRLFQDLGGHKGEIRSIAWRPDSQGLVSGSFDGTMKMWDMNEGKLIKSWDAHGGGVAAVAISNDGVMASTGRDNKVKVWDAGGNAAGEMPALVEAGHEVAITVDSKQVIAGDWAGNVRMWQRANPADEKLLFANPIPLEQSLAAAQQLLTQTQAAIQAVQTEFAAAQAQQVTAQKLVTDIQTQIASATAMLQTVTEQSVQLKAQSDAIVAQMATKASEFAMVSASKSEKTNQLNATVAAKKVADDAIAALQTQKTAAGADVAAIDAQIAAQTVQSQAQAVAVAKFQAEVEAVTADFVAREKQMAEMKVAFDTKNSEYAAASTRVQELTATKLAAEPKLEPANVALKASSDAVAAVQVKINAANAAMMAAQQKVDAIQADVARFAAFPAEVAAKKIAIEQAIAGAVAQVQPVETGILASKTQIETVSAEMAKMEQQMAALQAQLAAEQQKRTALQTEMAAKQQAANAIRSQIQQSEADLANAAMQQELLEKAFGKK